MSEHHHKHCRALTLGVEYGCDCGKDESDKDDLISRQQAEIERLKSYAPETAQTYDLEKLWKATEALARWSVISNGRSLESENVFATTNGGLLARCSDEDTAKVLGDWCQTVFEVQRFLVAFDKTAIELRKLQAEILALRGALEPFASLDIRHRSSGAEYDRDDAVLFGVNDSTISLGDVRRAKAALSTPSPAAKAILNVLDAVKEFIDDCPIGPDDKPYPSEHCSRQEFDNLVAAYLATRGNSNV